MFYVLSKKRKRRERDLCFGRQKKEMHGMPNMGFFNLIITLKCLSFSKKLNAKKVSYYYFKISY
jgi:hypothetical protein